MRRPLVIAGLLALLAAPARGQTPASVEQQVGQGAQLYAKHCAKCHGPAGQGVSKKGPALVGPQALPLTPPPTAKKRKLPFRTAADILGFVKKYMPNSDPGGLSDDEYEAIVAFALRQNGVTLQRPLSEETAASIVLHP